MFLWLFGELMVEIGNFHKYGVEKNVEVLKQTQIASRRDSRSKYYLVKVDDKIIEHSFRTELNVGGFYLSLYVPEELQALSFGLTTQKRLLLPANKDSNLWEIYAAVFGYSSGGAIFLTIFLLVMIFSPLIFLILFVMARRKRKERSYEDMWRLYFTKVEEKKKKKRSLFGW